MNHAWLNYVTYVVKKYKAVEKIAYYAMTVVLYILLNI